MRDRRRADGEDKTTEATPLQLHPYTECCGMVGPLFTAGSLAVRATGPGVRRTDEERWMAPCDFAKWCDDAER